MNNGSISGCLWHQGTPFQYTEIQENLIQNSERISISNYPNPFNPTTTISFNVAQSSDFATIEIYNLKGQKVRQFSIFNSQYSITWDGTDQEGKSVSSGIYFARLKAGKQTASCKMLLLK
jgi:flagellar hook assembly protein FlgD